MIAWLKVASLLVTDPSPSPVSPWLVATLQNHPVHGSGVDGDRFESRDFEFQGFLRI